MRLFHFPRSLGKSRFKPSSAEQAMDKACSESLNASVVSCVHCVDDKVIRAFTAHAELPIPAAPLARRDNLLPAGCLGKA